MTTHDRFVVADLASVGAIATNAAVLAALEAGASPQSRQEAPPWIVGGFGVGVHPDLVMRFFAIAEATGWQTRFVYGRPALIDDDGRLVAYASGMRDLYLRPNEAGRAVAMANGAQPRPKLGPDWLWIDAWLVHAPRPERVGMVAGWIRAASDAIGAAPDPIRGTPDA